MGPGTPAPGLGRWHLRPARAFLAKAPALPSQPLCPPVSLRERLLLPRQARVLGRMKGDTHPWGAMGGLPLVPNLQKPLCAGGPRGHAIREAIRSARPGERSAGAI